MQCFYCGAVLTPRRPGFPISPSDPTQDHVHPRRALKHEVRTGWWLQKNLVDCCTDCNRRKGSMLPLKWLSVMPIHGVDQLSRLLADLGVPQRRINKWRQKRGKS